MILLNLGQENLNFKVAIIILIRKYMLNGFT
jgi:hypothetical protein